MTWALVRNGCEIERHPNRATCVVAAIERGWAFRTRHRLVLWQSVSVREVEDHPRELATAIHALKEERP